MHSLWWCTGCYMQSPTNSNYYRCIYDLDKILTAVHQVDLLYVNCTESTSLTHQILVPRILSFNGSSATTKSTGTVVHHWSEVIRRTKRIDVGCPLFVEIELCSCKWKRMLLHFLLFLLLSALSEKCKEKKEQK